MVKTKNTRAVWLIENQIIHCSFLIFTKIKSKKKCLEVTSRHSL